MKDYYYEAIALCPGPKNIIIHNQKQLEALNYFAEKFNSEHKAAAYVWYLFEATEGQEQWIDKCVAEMEAAE